MMSQKNEMLDELSPVPLDSEEFEESLRILNHHLTQREIEKREREIVKLSPSKWTKFWEVSKIVLAFIAGVGGVLTAITGFQIGQLNAQKAKADEQLAIRAKKEALNEKEEALRKKNDAVEDADEADRQKEAAIAEKKKVEKDKNHIQSEITKLRREQDGLLAKNAILNKQNEETARVDKEKKSEESLKEVGNAEKTAAKRPATTKEQQDISEFVRGLFAESGDQRTKSYNALTKDKKLRASVYAVNKIIEMGSAEIDKSPEQTSIGLYHTIVTLTNMSRAATQKPEIRSKILKYADEVESVQPQLKERVETLKAWVKDEL